MASDVEVCKYCVSFRRFHFMPFSHVAGDPSDKRALVARQVITSRVSYLLLLAAPKGAFSRPSLRSSQFVVSTRFGVRPSAHPRLPLPGEYACVPFFPSRQEWARKSRGPPQQ